MDWKEAGVLDALRRVDAAYDEPRPECMIVGTLEEAAASYEPPLDLKDVAALRVSYGAKLEAHASACCQQLWPVSRAELPADMQSRKRACQLYYDAYCCAVWTSAHAEYVAACADGAIHPPEPTVATFPCASSGLDLSDLFARRVATKNDAAYPKVVEPLVQLMARATNPGARG